VKVPKLTRGRIVLAALGVVLVGLVSGFGPLVRSKVRAAAERRGAQVEVAWVKPGWGVVVLDGVDITHPDAPDVKVHLDRVRVSVGTPRRIEILGGKIELTGTPDQLAAEVERLRSRFSGPRDTEEPSAGATSLELSGVAVKYQGDAVDATLDGVSIARSDGKVDVRAERGEVTSAFGDAKIAGASIQLAHVDGELKISKVHTDVVDAHVGLAGAAASADAAMPATDELASGGRMKQVRRLLERLDHEASEALAPGGSVELDGVRATVALGVTSFGLGPARFVLANREGRIELEYRAGTLPAEASTETSSDFLSIKTELPRDTEPLAVTVRGGPISFAALGIREGDLHLVDVDRASLRTDAKIEIDPAFEVLAFDGSASISGVSFHAEAIAKDTVRGVKASFRGKVRAALDKSRVSVQGGELEIGSARLDTSFDLVREPPKQRDGLPRFKLDATYEVPLVACQAVLDAAPEGLLPTVAGMKMAGSLALKGTAKLDTSNLDRDYDVKWDFTSSCRVTDVPPSIDVAKFKKPWKRSVYPPAGGDTVEIEAGPGTGGWVSIGQISRFAEIGVVSFEDARFRSHEGFDQEAIKNSIRENLRTMKFTRGASTISMQLAKNLYLYRDKRLARKIEEAILTLYLEQALTKDQIIELYLNVVELGPMVYGVDDAARHYFNTSASRLTVAQAFYLASILPSPKQEHFAAGGAVSPGWLKHLRTVMKYANKRNRLPDDDLAAGLGEIPVRGSPTPLKDPNAETVPSGEDVPAETPEAPEE